jgi:hypothetical protein
VFCEYPLSARRHLVNVTIEALLSEYFIRFGPEDVYKNLLRDCELRKNRHSDSHKLRGENEFLSVLPTFTILLGNEICIQCC